MDQPAFEVIDAHGHRYQIWADGRIAGFPLACVVVNRTHQLIMEACKAVLEEERRPTNGLADPQIHGLP